MSRSALLGDIAQINPEVVGKNYPFSNILYLDTSSVTENNFSELQPFSLQSAPSRAKRIVRDGDIVYSTVRPNLKHFGYIKRPAENTVASTGFAVIRSSGELDSRYLYYWLSADERTDYLASIADSQTSTFPAFNPTVLAKLPIELPDLAVQRRIADILGSLDEKIELNRRMNEVLAQMGQALFRHYFINNPEATTWKVGCVADLGEVITGKTPSKARPENYGEDVSFLKVPDMHGQSIVLTTADNLSRRGANSQANKYIPLWSTCVSCIATVGVISMAGRQMQTNQQINSIIPKDKSFRFFNYFTAKDKAEHIKTMASGGSATPNLNKGQFEKIKVMLPPADILCTFDSQAEPIFEKIAQNTQELSSLTSLREALLPRLITGRLKA